MRRVVAPIAAPSAVSFAREGSHRTHGQLALAYRRLGWVSNLRSGEEVVVLQDGRSVEQGSRDDLLAARGALWKLWSAHGLSSPTVVADR
ncbi:MAG TPA: hypothetical protein VNB06_21845 [Thermoanaerobaculia bacterium]|nr:hypothetical protein [Thermoanaerobaculia bacterium]